MAVAAANPAEEEESLMSKDKQHPAFKASGLDTDSVQTICSVLNHGIPLTGFENSFGQCLSRGLVSGTVKSATLTDEGRAAYKKWLSMVYPRGNHPDCKLLSIAKHPRIDEESTGDCPLCGAAPAYPRAIPGVADGYADACDGCADAVVEAAAKTTAAS
jgi:hypothetical protein